MRHELSRRWFLRSSALTTAGATVIETASALIGQADAAESSGPPVAGPEPVPITLKINGVARTLQVEPRMTLAEALRGPLGLTGTKIACNRGACSACTVWLDGATVCSCMMLAIEVGARSVTTIEGLASGDQLHPVQAAFIEHDALQCGFCTPGMVMSCAALLEHTPIRAPRMCKRRSAAMSAAAAPIRMSSPRRWRPPKRERRDRWRLTGRHAREISVRHRERRLGEWSGRSRSTSRRRCRQCGARGDRQAVPRQNGRAKVTGATRFTVDVALPGMLHGRILRSPLPHARVRAIDIAAAARHPGVRAVMRRRPAGRSGDRNRALYRRARGRGRRRLHGRRRRGAAPDPRRLRAAALCRGHG